MANGRKKQSSSIPPELLACCCCIAGLLLGAMMFFGGVAFEGGSGQLGSDFKNEQKCIEDCLNDNYGIQYSGTIGIGTENVACLAIGGSKYSPELRAFMRAITNAEGTADAQGYFRMFGGKVFPSTTVKHPGSEDCSLYLDNQAQYGYDSDAYGRYQFISTTYKSWAAKANVPTVGSDTDCDGDPFYNISPQYQDISTAQELIDRGIERKLKSGNLGGAMNDVNATWTSVPGGSQQNAKSDQFASLYNKLLEEEMRGGCKSGSSSSSSSRQNTIQGVPYYNQTDFDEPLGSIGCGITSSSMLSEYIIKNDDNPEDQNLVSPQEFYEKHGFSLLAGISSYVGIQASETKFNALSPTDSWNFITDLIDNSHPMVIFTGYLRSSNDDNNYGHIMLLKGYKKDSNGKLTHVIVNDPYGDLSKQNYVANGEDAEYPIDDFTKRIIDITHQEGTKIYYIGSEDLSISPSTSSVGSYTEDQYDFCKKKCSRTRPPSNTDGLKCWPLPNQDKDTTLNEVYPGSGRAFKDARSGRDHLGNDLLVLDGGDPQPIRAIEDGTVIGLYSPFYCGQSASCSVGNDYYIEVQNKDGSYNGYGEVVNPQVNIGDQIKAGQIIAEITTGGAGMMHFERPLEPNADSQATEKFQDPFPYLESTTMDCTPTSYGGEGGGTPIANLNWIHPLDGATCSCTSTGQPVDSSYARDIGVDINCNVGTPVKAIMDGEIIYANWNGPYESDYGGYDDCSGGSRNGDKGVVKIQHPNGLQSYYAHLSDITNKQPGDQVVAGEVIGKLGFARTSHLHFSVYIPQEISNEPATVYICPFSLGNRLAGKEIYGEGWGYDRTFYGLSSSDPSCTISNSKDISIYNINE